MLFVSIPLDIEINIIIHNCNNHFYHLKVKWQALFIFVFLRSSIIKFTLKIFLFKNVFNLAKSAIVFSSYKGLKG